MVHYPFPKGGIPTIRAGIMIEDEDGVAHHAFRKPNKYNEESDVMRRRMAPGENNRLVYAPDELRPAVGQGKKKRVTRKRK
tara:strand:+ start:432 stop:674 length:243 start_codon:yes stop_codon:yes gene_type:complete